MIVVAAPVMCRAKRSSRFNCSDPLLPFGCYLAAVKPGIASIGVGFVVCAISGGASGLLGMDTRTPRAAFAALYRSMMVGCSSGRGSPSWYEETTLRVAEILFEFVEDFLCMLRRSCMDPGSLFVFNGFSTEGMLQGHCTNCMITQNEGISSRVRAYTYRIMFCQYGLKLYFALVYYIEKRQ